jgi:hypothetical protein
MCSTTLLALCAAALFFCSASAWTAPPGYTFPPSFSWKAQGKVTPVKNQGPPPHPICAARMPRSWPVLIPI